MTKDIFFCDNTKKPPAEGDKEGQKHEEVVVVVVAVLVVGS